MESKINTITNDNSAKSYKLVSWNILCKSLCTSNICPKLESKYQTWRHRLNLFSEIFEKLSDVDFFCFQEVDEHSDIERLLNREGEIYESVHFERPFKPQGISFFYRKSDFTLNKYYRVFLRDNKTDRGSNFVVVYFLEDNDGDNFCILNTHLRAFDEFEPVRVHQAESLLQLINSDEGFKEDFNNFKCNSVILCGDFNASPSFECIKNILNCQLSNEVLGKFQSVFNYFDQEKEDYEGFTIWLYINEEIKKPIDYIFFTKNVEILNKYIHKEITTEFGLPCATYPSDHCYLCVEFKFNN